MEKLELEGKQQLQIVSTSSFVTDASGGLTPADPFLQRSGEKDRNETLCLFKLTEIRAL